MHIKQEVEEVGLAATQLEDLARGKLKEMEDTQTHIRQILNCLQGMRASLQNDMFYPSPEDFVSSQLTCMEGSEKVAEAIQRLLPLFDRASDKADSEESKKVSLNEIFSKEDTRSRHINCSSRIFAYLSIYLYILIFLSIYQLSFLSYFT